MNFEERIKELKEKISSLNNEKIRAETQLQAAQEQKNKLIEEMKELNVTPDTIDDDIKKLEHDIDKSLSTVEHEIEEIERRLDSIKNG